MRVVPSSGTGAFPTSVFARTWSALSGGAVVVSSLGVVYASALLAPGPGGVLALVVAWLGVVVAVPPVARRAVVSLAETGDGTDVGGSRPVPGPAAD